MKILVTGTAGFIGHHVGKALAQRGDEVVGIDNINEYYDVDLKYGRLADAGFNRGEIDTQGVATSRTWPHYRFIKLDLGDRSRLFELFDREGFARVCHLAAQPGVRYSLENPYSYIDSNIVGFIHLLEACRRQRLENLVYASSSSVYGLNRHMPFSTSQNVDHPISLYAATKKSMELMAHAYSFLYALPTVGLRFFTVYGPWGRPDMATFTFVKNIFAGQPIDVYNQGKMERDFTYIDDIVKGIICTLDRPPQANPDLQGEALDPSQSPGPYRIYNIGNSRPVALMDFIAAIQTATGQKAEINLLPIQPGDIPATWADCSDLERDFNYRPDTPIQKGIDAFVAWYRDFYRIPDHRKT